MIGYYPGVTIFKYWNYFPLFHSSGTLLCSEKCFIASATITGSAMFLSSYQFPLQHMWFPRKTTKSFDRVWRVIHAKISTSFLHHWPPSSTTLPHSARQILTTLTDFFTHAPLSYTTDRLLPLLFRIRRTVFLQHSLTSSPTRALLHPHVHFFTHTHTSSTTRALLHPLTDFFTYSSISSTTRLHSARLI